MRKIRVVWLFVLLALRPFPAYALTFPVGALSGVPAIGYLVVGIVAPELLTVFDASLIVGGIVTSVMLDAPTNQPTPLDGMSGASAHALGSTNGPAMEVQLNSGDPLPTPSGWSPPTDPTSNPQPVPPVTGNLIPTSTLNYSSVIGTATCPDPPGACDFATTADAATRAWISAFNATQAIKPCSARAWEVYTGVSSVSATGFTGNWVRHSTNSSCAEFTPVAQSYGGSTTIVCSSGYVYSSGACSLSNAAAVQKPPGTPCSFIRNGNLLYPDAQNTAGCSTATLNRAGHTITVTSNSVTDVRSDGSYGNVTINSDGTTTITEAYPNYTNGQTEHATVTLGAPTSVGGGVPVTGTQGDGAGTPGIYSPTGGGGGPTPSVSLNPGGSGGSGYNPYPGNDYSRQGEASAAAATITAKMLDLNDVEPQLGSPTSSETVPTSAPSFSTMPIPFAGTESCPGNPTFTLTVPAAIAGTYTIDISSLCSFATTIKPLFLMLGAVGAAFIFAGINFGGG